jgi:hypothetical protein
VFICLIRFICASFFRVIRVIRGYLFSMPIVVDGNNLTFAFRKMGLSMGRVGLCRMLEMLAQRGERVCVVFDGPENEPSLQPHAPHVEMLFAAPLSADEVIQERILADTAPRRLMVVSTDKELRKAARRRRCQGVRSEDFVQALLRIAAAPPKPPPAEPPEKRQGLTDQQTSDWMREFGLEDKDEDEPYIP